QNRGAVIEGDVGEGAVLVVVLDRAIQQDPVGDRPVLVDGRVSCRGRVLPGHGRVLVIPRLRHVERIGAHRHLGFPARGHPELAAIAGLSGVALAPARGARISVVVGHEVLLSLAITSCDGKWAGPVRGRTDRTGPVPGPGVMATGSVPVRRGSRGGSR